MNAACQYVDKSKRKPYICGRCGRDIKHPCHQATIPGTEYRPARFEPELSYLATRRVGRPTTGAIRCVSHVSAVLMAGSSSSARTRARLRWRALAVLP